MRFPLSLSAIGLSVAGLFFVAAPVQAQEYNNIVPTMVSNYSLGTPISGGPDAPTPGSVYSNVDNFLGFGTAHGGTVANAGNGGLLTTTLLGDDLNSAGGDFNVMNVAGWGMKFSTVNFNSAATTARFRVRFYLRDGAGGVPGTALGGFSFVTTSIPSGVTTWTASGLSALAAFPANTTQIWAGIFFDNSGAAGTTAAQLDNLGQGNFSPPVIGTSADQDFLSGVPTNTFLVNNPTGAIRVSPFQGNPVANYGWEITAVPEPASLALAGLAMIGLGLRRRV